MKQGNVKLLAASAVVVALVLVFSYVTLGGEDPEPRTDVVIGDYYSYETTVVEGDLRITAKLGYAVSGMYLDGTLITVMFDDGEILESGIEMTAAEFMMTDADFGTIMGTESLDTPFGKKLCDVYSREYNGFDVTVWVCEGFVYKASTVTDNGSRTAVLVENTLLGSQLPEITPGRQVKDVEVGDWMTMNFVTDITEDGMQVVMSDQDVVAVNGDDITVRMAFSDGQVITRTMPLGTFLSDMPSGTGTLVGHDTVDYFGSYVLCDVYETYDEDGNLLRVYVSNGLAYKEYIDRGDGFETISMLSDTSLFGDAVGPEPRKEAALGDRIVYDVLVTTPEGTESCTQSQTVMSIRADGKLAVLVEDEGSRIVYMDPAEFIGVEFIDVPLFFQQDDVLETPFGDRRCSVYTYTIETQTGVLEFTAWMENSFCYRLVVFDGENMRTMKVVECTLLDPEPPAFPAGPGPKAPEVGDWISYDTTLTDVEGNVQTDTVMETVQSVGGGMVRTEVVYGSGAEDTVETTIAAFCAVPEDGVLLGSSLILVDGEFIAGQVWGFTDSDGNRVTAYMSNGFAYRYVSDLPGGFNYVMELSGTSMLG